MDEKGGLPSGRDHDQVGGTAIGTPNSFRSITKNIAGSLYTARNSVKIGPGLLIASMLAVLQGWTQILDAITPRVGWPPWPGAELWSLALRQEP